MDRELGWEGASKGNTRGKGDKNWGKQGPGNGEKGNERGGLYIYSCNCHSLRKIHLRIESFLENKL